MSFICMRVKNHCYNNGFALTLALKKRLGQLGNGLFDTTCSQTHAHFQTDYLFQYFI